MCKENEADPGFCGINCMKQTPLAVKSVIARNDRGFTIFLTGLFRLATLWACFYPALVLIFFQSLYWLRFARFPNSLIAPGFLKKLHHLTHWAGIDILVAKFLDLPFFIVLPVIIFCLLFIFFESVLAIYFLLCDSKRIGANLAKRISKMDKHNRRADQ